MLLYIYLVPAILGLLSMPSFHARWKYKNPHDSWDTHSNWYGDRDYMCMVSQPAALFLGSAMWPGLLAALIVGYTFYITRLYKVPGLLWEVLSLPGRYLAGNPPNIQAWTAKLKPAKDPYVLEGEKEVEALLTPKHHYAIKDGR